MDHNNTMEYRIGLEKQNKRNDQVTELILDNCRASQISGLTEEFVNLETLSLINVGLTTLKGFPKLPKLKKLEISDNRLTGGLNLLHGSPNLQHLNISGNRIKDFDALEPLKEFHDLVSLDLYNCEVTKVEDYRKKVFDLLPNLKALDGYDREEREVADSDEDDEDSDVENHITRDDNESDDEEGAVDDDDDDDEDGQDDDDDDDDGSYDESYGEMEGDYHPKGRIDQRPEVSDEEEDDYDEDDDDDDDDDDEDDDDDDDDDDMGDEAEDIEQNSNGDLAAASSEHNPISNNNSALRQNDLDGADDDVQEIADESHDGGEDVGDEEEEEDDDEEDADADLKTLQKDSIVEDDDDVDFEPTHEPDERDHEIDPEDDADEDNAEGDTTGQLESSKLDTTTTEISESDVADKRGQKRKLEDEGGDEVESGTAPSGQE